MGTHDDRDERSGIYHVRCCIRRWWPTAAKKLHLYLKLWNCCKSFHYLSSSPYSAHWYFQSTLSIDESAAWSQLRRGTMCTRPHHLPARRGCAPTPVLCIKPSATWWPTSNSVTTRAGCLQLNERPKNLKIWRITREMRLSQVLILSICPILCNKMRFPVTPPTASSLICICSQRCSVCPFLPHKFHHRSLEDYVSCVEHPDLDLWI